MKHRIILILLAVVAFGLAMVPQTAEAAYTVRLNYNGGEDGYFGIEVRIQKIGALNWTDWEMTDVNGEVVFDIPLFDDNWQFQWRVTEQTAPPPAEEGGTIGNYAPGTTFVDEPLELEE